MSADLGDYIARAETLLASARLLAQAGDPGSAASRLYYAMFHSAQALLLCKDLSFSSHREVIGAFSRHFVKEGELPADMHEWLRLGFWQRQAGDYEAVITLSRGDVDELQQKAERFVELAKSYLAARGLV